MAAGFFAKASPDFKLYLVVDLINMRSNFPRMALRLRWTVLVLTCLCLRGLEAQVIINEISYNPPESGTDSLEYIELFNAGGSTVNLAGWYFTSGVEDTLPNVDLPPGGYFVTAIKASAMQTVFGITVHQWSGNALNNSGEKIILVDAAANVIDSVQYDDADPWPVEADGSGPSLELRDPGLDNSDGANWQVSGAGTGVILNGFEVSGTPGAENSGGGGGGPAVTIEAAHLDFTPQHAVVKIGDLVRWVNNEAIPHNVNGTQAIYLGNPEDIYSGDPMIGPWQFDYTPNTAGLYHYQCDVHVGQGMTGTLSVYNPLTYTDFPLSHLRLADANGSHIFDGVPTRVTGVVHGINFLPSGYSFYVIDENNVGINVFSPTPGSYTVTEGDKVMVSGVIDQFNGLLEIIPDAIDVLATNQPLLNPLDVAQVDESLEGSLVTCYPFTIDSIVATGSSGYNMFTTHQSGNKVLIRVDADLGYDSISLTMMEAVIGVGSQFDPSFPYTDGYQIQAFFLFFGEGLAFLDQGSILMNPNPVSDQLYLNSEIEMDRIDLYGMDGRLMKNQIVHAKQEQMDVSDLLPGWYIIKVSTGEGLWTSKVIVGR